jgi:hypothetical protein
VSGGVDGNAEISMREKVKVRKIEGEDVSVALWLVEVEFYFL